jgi:hypothetical protein
VYYTYVFVGVCGSRGTLCVKATKICDPAWSAYVMSRCKQIQETISSIMGKGYMLSSLFSEFLATCALYARSQHRRA